MYTYIIKIYTYSKYMPMYSYVKLNILFTALDRALHYSKCIYLVTMKRDLFFSFHCFIDYYGLKILIKNQLQKWGWSDSTKLE